MSAVLNPFSYFWLWHLGSENSAWTLKDIWGKIFFSTFVKKEKSSFSNGIRIPPVDLFGEISNICHSIWHFKAWKVLSSNLGQSNFMTAVGEKKSQVVWGGVQCEYLQILKKCNLREDKFNIFHIFSNRVASQRSAEWWKNPTLNLTQPILN